MTRNAMFTKDKIEKTGPFKYILMNLYPFMYVMIPVSPEKIKTVLKLIWENNEIKILNGFAKILLLSYNIRMINDIISNTFRFLSTEITKSQMFFIRMILNYGLLIFFKKLK